MQCCQYSAVQCSALKCSAVRCSTVQYHPDGRMIIWAQTHYAPLQSPCVTAVLHCRAMLCTSRYSACCTSIISVLLLHFTLGQCYTQGATLPCCTSSLHVLLMQCTTVKCLPALCKKMETKQFCFSYSTCLMNQNI